MIRRERWAHSLPSGPQVWAVCTMSSSRFSKRRLFRTITTCWADGSISGGSSCLYVAKTRSRNVHIERYSWAPAMALRSLTMHSPVCPMPVMAVRMMQPLGHASTSRGRSVVLLKT